MIKELLFNPNIPVIILAYTFCIYSGLLYWLHRAEQPLNVIFGWMPIPMSTKTWGMIKTIFGTIVLFQMFFELSGNWGAICLVLSVPFYYHPIICYKKGKNIG